MTEISEATMSKLELKEGDVLLVRVPAGMKTDNREEYFAKLRRVLEAKGYRDVLVIVLDDSMDMQSLDESAMYELGWVRAPNMSDTLH